ncbi:hypothetical protein FOL47_005587 [Perkinsus chesapeaki]|uniref:Uncharacterized protein n=1 Tax=Perkinsus chesapeaki TaxID=330153 RepID=A0A7J6LXI0_PERCH|nr:hypothetical protein FOL47_005587 [Perkinsus chesapeaki]
MPDSASSTNEPSSIYKPPLDREPLSRFLARRERPRILPILPQGCSFGGSVSLLIGPRLNTAIKDLVSAMSQRWTSNTGRVCIFDCSLEFVFPKGARAGTLVYSTPSVPSLLASLRHFHRQHLARPEVTVDIGWLVIINDWTCLKNVSEAAGVLGTAFRYLEELSQSYDFPLVFTGLPITSSGWVLNEIAPSDPSPWIVPGSGSRQLLASGRLWLRGRCLACGKAAVTVYDSTGGRSFLLTESDDSDHQDFDFVPITKGAYCSCKPEHSITGEELMPSSTQFFPSAWPNE